MCIVKNSTDPYVASLAAFVQLKDYRQPTKIECRYFRWLGDNDQCDSAALSEDQIRAYFLELCQCMRVVHFGVLKSTRMLMTFPDSRVNVSPRSLYAMGRGQALVWFVFLA